MPFNKPLPTWNAIGTEPPQSKKDEGWLPNDKPPADWFNWYFYTAYQILKEMKENAIHTDRVGVTVASLVNGKVPASQLDISIVDASTTVKGIVKLSSATDSTSEVLAATPKAVKAAYDLANSKTSFSGNYNDLTNKPTIPSTAAQVSVVDSANYYASTNVEGVTQEIGYILGGTRTNLVTSMQTLFNG